ncbi:PREDICTED: growth/differentiation factor 15-like [Gekko japonicus]|uniref:Growth/differentiation factor 15-like n=1 Tax=Gekko japonicus TaxID=146911 RepID=A0ABM1KS42_GEKJA|nr:PREDICTED: growth/differentiation factor 15-like [Gekko japonicus]
MPRPQYLIPGLAVVMALLSMVDPRPSGGRASQLQLEAIKQSLLERLGLERPPVVRQPLDQDGLQRAHQVYREMLAQFRANRTAAELGTTVHLLRPKLKHVAEGPPGRLEAPGHFYTLELPRTASLHQNLLVLRAELQLFKEALNWPDISRSNSTWATRVNIYKLVDGESLAPKLLASYVLSRTSLTLDLRDPVDHWMAGPEQRLLLGLEFSADVSPLLATTTTAEGTEALSLEVATQEHVRVRKARQLNEECGKGDGKCCLRSLKVSFEDIGWSDWVVAPSSYSMKFCEGSCPQNYKPASIHAQIKYRLHSLSGETPAPCCVPAAYEPMVVMHFGTEGKLVTQLFQDMIVTRCHCA